MNTIEKAKKMLEQEMAAKSYINAAYWSAFIDGAEAILRELKEEEK